MEQIGEDNMLKGTIDDSGNNSATPNTSLKHNRPADRRGQTAERIVPYQLCKTR